MMPGVMPVVVSPNPLPTVSWTDSAGDNTAVTTHTFAGTSIGAASATRLVVVGIDNLSGAAPSSVTIAGVSASLVSGSSIANGSPHVSFWQASVPTGTTGTITVNLTSAGSAWIGVFAIYDLLSTTRTDAATDATTGASGVLTFASLTVSANGVAVGYANSTTVGGGTWTWTTMTERFDDASTGASHSGATYTTTAGATISPTATSSLSFQFFQGAAVSYR